MTQTVPLGDIADIQTGPFGSQLHQEDYVSKGTPIITVEHLGNDRITTQNLPMVSDQDKQRLSKYWIQEGDTIFSRVGSVDRASYVHKEEDGWLFSGRCLRVRPDESKVNPQYLSFVLRSPKFTNYIKSIAVGATMPSINTKLLSTAPVTILPRDAQDKVADILDGIEQKIELNRKMNETLEQMGQALFRHYFIDNPEAEKWEEGKLGEITDVNKESIGKDYPHNEIQYIDISSASTGSIDKYEKVELDAAPSRAKRIVHDGDIIWAMVRPNRRTYSLVMSPTENMIVSSGFAVLSPKEDALGFVYYYTSSRSFTDYLTLHARGAAYPAVTASDFRNAPITIPDKNTLQVFNELVMPNLRIMGELKQQIQTLTTLRDTLLPRLISEKAKEYIS